MTRRVNMHLDEELAAEIERHKPRSLALSAFCALLIEQQLARVDTVAKLPAYRVGAGKDYTETPETQRQGDQQPTAVDGGLHVVSAGPNEHIPPVVVGGSVGRGVQGGTPRGGTSPLKEVPEDLAAHAELIHAFWKVKKGSRSDTSWKIMLTELRKIRDKYGEELMVQQIQNGTQSGNWNSITLANTERFMPKAQVQEKTEPRHPASRVFTAERGFEDEPPVTNPVLQGLF